MNLDQKYQKYATNPTQLDALLVSITRYARGIAINMRHSDPDDVAQRATILCWQRWTKYSAKGSFAGWVSRVTRNLILDDYRKGDPVDQLDDEDESAEEEVVAVYPVTDHHPNRDFSTLPEQMHKVAAMLKMGYTRQEIAESIGCSIRTLERLVTKYSASHQTFESEQSTSL